MASGLALESGYHYTPDSKAAQDDFKSQVWDDRAAGISIPVVSGNTGWLLVPIIQLRCRRC